MASACKIAGITIGALLVVGLVVGSLTWAILASREDPPQPPEIIDLDWWEYTVLYQIYPRSFKDSDGDGIGDLKGITSELEHFVDCGAGAIWLSPIFKSPMVDFGYDVSDFYNIQDEYGTMEDFEEMIAKAHSLGIKVLLDYVPNHSSDQAEYFIKSERREDGYDDWYIWADGIQDPNNSSNTLVPSNWISQFGGTVWQWSDIRQQYYLHQFAIEQPDFNFRNPAVRQEMLNILDFWFKKGVDGFRLDAIPHLMEAEPDASGRYPDEPLSGNLWLTPDQPGYTTQIHVRDLIELYDVVYEWRTFSDQWQRENGGDTKALLAEAYANITMTMLYYGDERGRLGAHFPFNFDFITSLWGGSNARDFAFIIQRWLTYMPRGKTANWVFGNHDNNRMPSRFRDNMVDGLNSLNMLLPGVAVTYQGEEIGMRDGFVSWEDTVDVNAINQGNEDNYLEFSRDPCRTPYHWNNSTNAGFSTGARTWLPMAQDYMEINLQKQKDDARSHYKVYQSITKLRNEPTLSHGDYRVQALTENTLVLARTLATYDTYALVFNVGTVADTIDLSTVHNLNEPLEVYTSSVHSTRVAGTSIPLGSITLQSGEALVLKAPPT
ncbi:maltase A1-like [Pectinophora gossypiella]|uniref:maltase A1-like n=1 Tax=Pectinophora gossypiella TaxID=13191 RepID=UPI00214E78FE|nr:maltase A1-like [Pectinophora gossypiella]